MHDSRRVGWVAFAALCGALLVHLAVYLVDHRSTALLILATLVALGAATASTAALWVAFRFTPNNRLLLRQSASRWRWLYLVTGLALSFGFGLVMRPEWLYAHIALTLGFALVLAYDLLYGSPITLARWQIAFIALAAAAVTLVRILGLSVYPTHNIIDEPWVLSWALSVLRDGQFSDMLMFYGGSDIQRFMLPVSWWVSIVGHSFWQTRLFFFLLTFPLTVLAALAARNFYTGTGSGATAGWVTALVMFSSAIVMRGAHIRHDIGMALALAAALWLSSKTLRHDRARFHFLAGLVMGLGIFAHYHAALFGVMLAISVYGIDYLAALRQQRWLPPRGFWWFALGGVLGAGVVVLFQIVPDWQGFQATRVLRHPLTLQGIIETFLGYWGNIGSLSQFELLLILVALAAAFWRRRLIDLKLALLTVLLNVALTIQAHTPFPQYLNQLSAVYAILVATLFTSGFAARRVAYAGAAAALVLAANLGYTLQIPLNHLLARQPLELPVPPVAAWIRENVTPSQKLLTEHWYYLFLTDYNFISPHSWGLAPLPLRQDNTAEAFWDQIAPDVVVFDRNLSTCCMPPILTTEYLDSRGYTVVAEIPGERYPVLVYEKGVEND